MQKNCGKGGIFFVGTHQIEKRAGNATEPILTTCRPHSTTTIPQPHQEFDKQYNPTWHCIVGRNFGSYVTHETKHFVYFYLGQVAILLFKSG